jgi:phage baseplate assembly protein W
MATLAPKLPLALDASTQYEMIKDYPKLAAQNLKMLILTIPGERMMDVDFGVGIPKYLFENNDNVVRAEIKARLYEQVNTYLPYIDILEVNFHSSIEDPTVSEHYLGMRIIYNIIPVGIVSSLSISMDGSSLITSSEIVSYS